MTKGLTFEPSPGRFKIVYGSRVVSTTDGTLLQLLTTTQSYLAQSLAFPDISKDNAYRWNVDNTYNAIAGNYSHANAGTSWITAIPQEYSATQVVDTVPAGADFFVGRIKLSRTTAPANSWQGRTLNVIPPTGVWIPFMGGISMQVEAEFGFARMLHLYMSGGQLLLGKQQSVSVAPAGYVTWGNTGGGIFASTSGGNWSYGSAAGMPISLRAGPSQTTSGPNGSFLTISDRARGGANQVAVNDNTNYASTYSVDIVGRFGRRS